MNAALVASLIAQYGIPLAKQIYDWVQEGRVLTPEDWVTLEKLSQYRSTDALTAAGIKIVDGKVVKL